MRSRLASIFWLGTKELRSLQRDTVIVALLVFAFTFSVYTRATGTSSEVHNATVGIVDEDRSALSRSIAAGLFPPHFHTPQLIEASEVEASMDSGRFMFVLDIPPDFEADVLAGRRTEIQLSIDATAITQATIGASYIVNIASREISRFVGGSLESDGSDAVELITHMAFNPNSSSAWFISVVTIVDQITLLTIILTGASLVREREHGTIEHLLVMPLTSFEIATSKVWPNALVVLASALFSMFFIVQWLLEVPVAGSVPLFVAGTALYLFFATALGIFLGTIARSMAQFALLVLLVVMPMRMLSGGMTPIESQPDWLQPITFLLPSRHFVDFSQSIIFRGAGLDIVWREFFMVTVLGLAFFVMSLALFRRSTSA